jgi:hypothetical protein
MNMYSVVIIINRFWRIIFRLLCSFVEMPVTIPILVSLLWSLYCKLSLLWPKHVENTTHASGMELNLSILTDIKLLNESILWTALVFGLPCRSGKCMCWCKIWHRISTDIFSVSGVCLLFDRWKVVIACCCFEVSRWNKGCFSVNHQILSLCIYNIYWWKYCIRM